MGEAYHCFAFLFAYEIVFCIFNGILYMLYI